MNNAKAHGPSSASFLPLLMQFPEGLSGPVSAHILSEPVRLSQGRGYINTGCAGCSPWSGQEGEPTRGLGCQRPFPPGRCFQPSRDLAGD